MIRKVLVMNATKDGVLRTKGILSLESGIALNGRLKVFEIEPGDLTFSLKIGENLLHFDSVPDPSNFEFKSVFHALEQPVCAVLHQGGKILAVGKTEDFRKEPASIFQANKVSSESLAEDGDPSFSEPKNQPAAGDITEPEQGSLAEPEELEESFFEQITPQLDELFSKYPRLPKLEEMVENTQWVKVDFASGEVDHYIVGKIFENGKVTHLCYGIPSAQRGAPPANMAPFCQWLPQNLENPDQNGYWVMYQNAQTGKNIEV